MDYATRNKRFLAEACEANGLPISGSPAELFATLSARSVVSLKRVKPLDMGPLIKAVYVQDELNRMIAEDKLPHSAKLEAEAEERWEVVKKQRLDGSEIHIPIDMEKDVIDNMHSEGYESVVIEPEGIYLRQTKKPETNAEDLREKQDTEYAIAQVEDMKKEEAAMLHKKPVTDTLSLDSTMLALQDVISGKKNLSVDDFTGLVVPLIEKLDAVLPEDSKHVLRNLLLSHITTDTSAAIAQESHADMGIVRRRLMDWLVINALSEADRSLRERACGPIRMFPHALLVMAGVYDNEKLHGMAKELQRNPRVVASKLAYAVFPDDVVGPLTYDEKKLADKPQGLWTESELKLYGEKVDTTADDADKEEDDKKKSDQDESSVGIGTIRVREDGRKEKLLAEDDEAAVDDDAVAKTAGEVTEMTKTVDA